MINRLDRKNMEKISSLLIVRNFYESYVNCYFLL